MDFYDHFRFSLAQKVKVFATKLNMKQFRTDVYHDKGGIRLFTAFHDCS